MAPALRARARFGAVTLARMRTAVVRIGVDPSGELSAAQLRAGMTALVALGRDAGAEVIETDLAAMPPSRREVEVLLATDDHDDALDIAMQLCANAFGVLGAKPVPGVVTYVSRGTDEDANGVLAGLGLTGAIERLPSGPDGPGWDTVVVTLNKADLVRVPESRVHTALEASLNCEVHIRTV
ncbi:hypothetical protein BH09ACT7_BH09ACT7_38110 [soil metagenome]